jgi:hypothetical protein
LSGSRTGKDRLPGVGCDACFSFDVEHGYSGADGISVPVTLRHGQDKVSFEADVDTGSTFCIFNRGHAETLGLSVESGERTRFKTVTRSFDAYGHMLTLETLGYSFDVTVYFAAHESFTRNVLADAAGSIKCGSAWLSMRASFISAVTASDSAALVSTERTIHQITRNNSNNKGHFLSVSGI